MVQQRSLQAILFTDIVASTRRASELGDHAWSELLQEHHQRVRREIRRFGGREIKALGDGFLASFRRPSEAVRCAWAIRESTRELGLEVRAGIHVGEVENQAGDLTGIAVHICARITSLAAPGEILVSHAVREMGTGAGFHFRDRGKHTLEGLSDEWRLHELQALPTGTSSIRTGRWVPEPTRRQLAIGAGVLVLLFVSVLLWKEGRDRMRVPVTATADVAAEPAIAVLPFTVNDPDIEGWREGLVTLLSTGLDGAGGLRAIDSPTILAQWDRLADQNHASGLAQSLEVARATGARYALVGSATAVGPSLRIVGDLYRTAGGEKIGQVQAEGSENDVLDLVDRLAIDVLRLVLERSDELSEVDLEAVTTSSLPALKAFLEGNALYRRSDFVGAGEAYERAVASDSTFALAYYHLAQSYGWQIPEKEEEMVEAADRAAELLDRLPRREATFTETMSGLIDESLDGFEPIREATRRYPDDAEAWYLLGEHYYHIPQALGTMEDADAAFRKAVEILPAFAPYRIHLVSIAFLDDPDSARVAAELREYARLSSPSNEERREFELAFALAFGDDSTRSRAVTSIDTIGETTRRNTAVILGHPKLLDHALVLGVERSPVNAFHDELYKRGHLRNALDSAGRPGAPPWFRSCALMEALMFGIPIPPEVLEAELALTEADSTPGPRTVCAGLYAVHSGRRADHARSVAIHRGAATRALAEGDSASARSEAAWASYLEGYARWRSGDARAALPLLKEAFREYGGRDLRFLIGRIHLEIDEPVEAARYFRGIRLNPLADYHLGLALEASGDHGGARLAYESLVAYWRDADPELRPLVERARQAMIRVGGLRRE